MYEFMNAATTGLLFLFIHERNSFYVNASLFAFGSLAILNHIFPRHLKGLIRGVKFTYSLLLFALVYEERIEFAAKDILRLLFGVVLILELSPVFTKSVPIVESFGVLVRRVILLVAYKEMLGTMYLPMCIVTEIIYYFERKERMQAKHRESFGLLHCGEQFAVLLIFIHSFLLSHHFSLQSSIVISLMIWIFQALLKFLYNHRLIFENTYTYPIPVKDKNLQKQLNQIFQNKVHNQNTWYNLLMKPLLPPLFFCEITWEQIDDSLAKIISKYQLRGTDYDYIFGVSTGGALIAPLLAKQLHISDEKVRILSNPCRNKVNRYVLLFEEDLSIYNSKRILVLNNNIVNTGITIKTLSEQLQMLTPSSLDFMCLIQSPDYSGDIKLKYDEATRVPIFWPWGDETD